MAVIGQHNLEQVDYDDEITLQEQQWVKDWVEWRLGNVTAGIEHQALSLSEIDQKHTLSMTHSAERIQTLENRFLIIEASTGTPAPVSATEADYELTCLQVSGQDVLGCEYQFDQVVYIRGQAPDNVGQFNWGIKKGGLLIASSQSSIPSNGQFLFVWNVSADEALSSYTAIVEINGKIDSLQFELK